MSALKRLLDRQRQDRRVLLMGVLNTTPDSFSDGGKYVGEVAAERRVDELLSQGADIVDIGGESTRPGAEPVPSAEQVARIEHALRYAVERGAVVSVDTSSAEVARHALSRGAAIINDVSCLADDSLARVVAAAGGSLVLMHARGVMKDMRGFSDAPGDAYGDVVADVRREWSAKRSLAVEQGLDRDDIVFDPGLGFMKNARHSLELLQRLGEFATLGAVIAVGPSRKSFLAKLAGANAAPLERMGGTIAACLAAAARGASILRVHDVFEMRQALLIWNAIEGAPAPSREAMPLRPNGVEHA